MVPVASVVRIARAARAARAVVAARAPRAVVAARAAHALVAAGAAVALAGCATRAADVVPVPDNPTRYAAWSCERIDDESETVQRRAAELAWDVDERAGNNVVALGVGFAVFWPALLALRPQGAEADELAQLKGRFEALRAAAARASCPSPSADLSPARAAALPVAVGDRLVYEERPLRADGRLAAGGAPVQRAWTVRALRREEIEFGAASAAAGGDERPWHQDRVGNVVDGPPGTLLWPKLLRGELALGQVMAGDITVAGDPLARSRVRAQVVARGPQHVGGRRFDAVVLELFGDVLQDAGSTRLDGALVVDRASGVLLRLDLRSAAAPYRLQRRLIRVER